jgi:hypothetical protein
MARSWPDSSFTLIFGSATIPSRQQLAGWYSENGLAGGLGRKGGSLSIMAIVA